MSQAPLSLAEIVDKLSVEVESGIRYVFDDTYLIDFNALQDPIALSSLTRPMYAFEETLDVKQYNRMVDKKHRILIKDHFNEQVCNSDEWLIPSEYKQLTVMDLQDRCTHGHDARGITPTADRLDRIDYELAVFSVRGLIPVIQTMCYIIDELTNKNEVWGVGRGSSVASYVLFLLGVHDVDSIAYGLDFEEFVT